MSGFTQNEMEYLASGGLLGRLATVGPDGMPHVVPVGWRYNPEEGTIDVSGRNFAATKKFRNVKANPKAAFVVDDVLPPWRPRSVMIQGDARAIEASDGGALIRITPEKVTSWGLDAPGK